MTPEVIESLCAWMREENERNLYVKFFPRVEEGFLVSISVRFFVPNPRKNLNGEKKHMIMERIRQLSHGRLVPDDNGLFDYGILELKASYIHRYCRKNFMINTLSYIANEMIPSIDGENNPPLHVRPY